MNTVGFPARSSEPDTVRVIWSDGSEYWCRPGPNEMVKTPTGLLVGSVSRWLADRTLGGMAYPPLELIEDDPDIKVMPYPDERGPGMVSIPERVEIRFGN